MTTGFISLGERWNKCVETNKVSNYNIKDGETFKIESSHPGMEEEDEDEEEEEDSWARSTRTNQKIQLSHIYHAVECVYHGVSKISLFWTETTLMSTTDQNNEMSNSKWRWFFWGHQELRWHHRGTFHTSHIFRVAPIEMSDVPVGGCGLLWHRATSCRWTFHSLVPQWLQRLQSQGW